MFRNSILISLAGVLFLIFSSLDACTHQVTHQTAATTLDSSTAVAPGDPNNIWPDIASSFSLKHYEDNPEIKAQIKWYMNHKTVITQTIDDAAPFLYYILQETKRRHLPGELVLLPIVESSYNPTAYSYLGAAGLWQLMPGTATGLGITQDWWYDGRRDVFDSTQAAFDYFVYLHDFFNGDWLKAIAAYNSGEGTVQRAERRNRKLHRKTDVFSLDLPRQTQAYLPKLLALAIIISQPDKYPLDLPIIADKPVVKRIKLTSQIDLTQAAQLAHMSTESLYDLNPGFIRWATDPNVTSYLVLPIDKVNTFEVNVKQIPKAKRVTWLRHNVKKGDSLSVIAKRNDTTVSILRKVNDLPNDQIYIHEELIIPKTAHSLTRYDLNNHQHYVGRAPKHIPGPKKKIYTVKKHDTLSKIAKRYHLRPAAIRFWNQLNNNHLHIGDKLTLWIRKKHHYTHHRHYTVKKGDTLSGIAHRYHVSTKQLMRQNHLHHANQLRIGQHLVV